MGCRCGYRGGCWLGDPRFGCPCCSEPPEEWLQAATIGGRNRAMAIQIAQDLREGALRGRDGLPERDEQRPPGTKRPVLKCYFKRSLKRVSKDFNVTEKSVREVFSCLSTE